MRDGGVFGYENQRTEKLKGGMSMEIGQVLNEDLIKSGAESKDESGDDQGADRDALQAGEKSVIAICFCRMCMRGKQRGERGLVIMWLYRMVSRMRWK